jgi:hypothetical protein
MRRLVFAPPVMALLAAVLLAACSSSALGQSYRTYASYGFSCCAVSDISSAWHPGQAITLHWTAQPGPSTIDARVSPIAITIELVGPYKDVTTLKSGQAGARTVLLATINTNDRVPSLPASLFTLPVNLAPGLYNLELNYDYGGGNGASTASVVEVTSQP